MELLALHNDLKKIYEGEVSKKFKSHTMLATSFMFLEHLELQLYGAERFLETFWPIEFPRLAQIYRESKFGMPIECLMEVTLNNHLRIIQRNLNLFPSKTIKNHLTTLLSPSSARNLLFLTFYFETAHSRLSTVERQFNFSNVFKSSGLDSSLVY